jgi:hypothetical protein
MPMNFRARMERARGIIVDGGPAHPLHFLLDAGGFWKGRWGWQDEVAVQAGHATSRFSGLTERFMLEDADYNQMRSTPESRGIILARTAVEIGGVPVEMETARYWQQMGLLPGFDLRAAARTWGW